MIRSDPAATSPLQPLIDSLPCGLGVFDRDRRLVAWNAPFPMLLGLSGEALQPGMGFAALVEATRSAASGSAQPGGLMLMDGTPPPQPRRVERLLGAGMLVEVHAAALPDGGLSLRLQDISAQRQAAEALRRTRAQADQLLAMVRQARADSAHGRSSQPLSTAELARSLRSSTRTLATLLQLLESAGLPDRPGEWAAQADDIAHSLLRTLDDVADLATWAPGQLALEPRPFELEQLLRELSGTYAAIVGERPLEFIFEVDPRLPPRLLGDDRRLRQVLVALGSLAIRGGGAPERVLRVTLADRTDIAATLTFSLTGAEGAPPGDDGDGLAACHELLRAMGSELRRHGEAGPGERFEFRLTLPVDRSASVTTGPLTTPGLPVLVADHRPATRAAIARMGRALGWDVLEAGNLQEATQTLRSARPSVLLVHWQLDGTAPFSAALEAAEAVVGRPVAPVLLGHAAAWGPLARLPDAQRRKLGTCVSLPATAAMLAEAVEQALSLVEVPAAGAAGARPLQGMRVLLAEDDPGNQVVTRDLLQGQGAQVEVAVDGLDTLTSLVANGRYDAILMDWQMPNMDGLETTREIRQIVGFESIPIIALTASATAADRQACLDAGMNAHLAKPVDAAELVSTLRRHARADAASAGPARAGGRDAAKPAAGARIEREAAISRLGGDAGLYARVLDRFRLDMPREMANLEQAWRRGDRPQARRLAHTLKGSAGTVGAQQLAQSAKQFESLLAGAASAGEQQAWSRLRETAEATMKALRA